MDAEDRPDVSTLPEGFVLVDRAGDPGTPHPMQRRSGEGVEARLRQCSLYDPTLDLGVDVLTVRSPVMPSSGSTP